MQPISGSRGRIDRPASNERWQSVANLGRMSTESNIKIEGSFVLIENV